MHETEHWIAGKAIGKMSNLMLTVLNRNMETIIPIILLIILLVVFCRLNKKKRYDSGATTRTSEKGWGLFFFLSFSFIFVVSLNFLSKKEDRHEATFINLAVRRRVEQKEKEEAFRYACDGDYWIIEDDNITVSKKPKVSANEAQFIRNLVTILENGTKVEIVKSEGSISPWKLVYVYNERGGTYAKGWILAETVKKARRTQKGKYCS